MISCGIVSSLLLHATNQLANQFEKWREEPRTQKHEESCSLKPLEAFAASFKDPISMDSIKRGERFLEMDIYAI